MISIIEKAKSLGFLEISTTELQTPLTIDFYRSWLEQGFHGEMEYLAKHLPLKANPTEFQPLLKSAIVLTAPYFPHPRPVFISTSLRTAAYSQGEDYHLFLKEKMSQLIAELKIQYPDNQFYPATDSQPILERDLAKRAGLGWFGKNTCLIDRKHGSLFFLCEILTDLEFQTTATVSQDFCGTCTKCMEACPTQAFESPRVLNAKKCISYLTIESRQIPPVDLREKVQDWFFGCDLCQNVCPWNQKLFKEKLEIVPKRALSSQDRADLLNELREVLTLSGKKLQKKFAGTPFLRAGPFGLRRNAILVATNQQLSELKDVIESWKNDLKLAELVQWSLSKLEETCTSSAH